MGKKKTTRRGGKKVGAVGVPDTFPIKNYIPKSTTGCHIIHSNASWVLESSSFHPDDWDVPVDSIPDLSLDPENFVLTAINTTPLYKSYFISVLHACTDRSGKSLKMGKNILEDGSEQNLVTFILILKPFQVLDLCYVEIEDISVFQLFSDIKELPSTWDYSLLGKSPNFTLPSADIVGPYDFPLKSEDSGEFLCSQGMFGGLTHFYAHTCYAVDFECAVGTPVVAVANGTVHEIQQNNSVSGIHVNNLFLWNSIILKLEDGNYVEYVHIKQNSVVVNVGDSVVIGQKLCESGGVGFCPAPHLHIQFHKSPEENAPTIPFCLKDKNQKPYIPVAGGMYS